MAGLEIKYDEDIHRWWVLKDDHPVHGPCLYEEAHEWKQKQERREQQEGQA